MGKEYRNMTHEEQIKLIQAVIKKDGFAEFIEIAEKYKIALAIEKNESPVHITDSIVKPVRNILNKDGLAGFAENPIEIIEEPKELQSNTPDLEQGSIYASEHRPLAMEENGIGENIPLVMEEPKTKVLEKGSYAPNPWSDAEIVTPGQLKL